MKNSQIFYIFRQNYIIFFNIVFTDLIESKVTQVIA